MVKRTTIDDELRGQIKDLEQVFREFSDRLLSLPLEVQALHIKSTMHCCTQVLKKSLQALPPEQ